MVHMALAFLFRKPDTTMAQYIEHYENTHMQILRDIGGEHFPLSHTRHYVHRTESASVTTSGGPSNLATPATMFYGSQTTVDFDCVAVLTFADETHIQGFQQAISAPEAAAKIKADEMLFLDTSKSTVVLGDRIATTTKE